MLITQKVKLINKKEFVALALDANSETFVVYVVALNIKSTNIAIHLSPSAQIELLKVNKAPTTVFAKYSDYTNIFLLKLTAKLPEYTGINNHAIDLEKDKHPSYGLIYSLKLVELETFKAYIKTDLANNIIRSSQSPAGALIFFDHKSNASLRFFVDYCSLNNLTIKNQYPLLLIGKLLNSLSWAKLFI